MSAEQRRRRLRDLFGPGEAKGPPAPLGAPVEPGGGAAPRPAQAPSQPAAPGPQPPIEVPPTEPFLPRHWLIWLAALAVLGLAFALAGRPIYRGLKTWRAHGFVAQAEQLIQQRKWLAAFDKARAAYQLSPADAKTLRLIARLEAAAGRPDAIIFWKNLIRIGKAMAVDRRELGEFALRVREFGAAFEQMDWLLAHEPAEFATLKFAAECAFVRGEPARAKEFCRKALRHRPADQGLQLLLARLLARSADIGEQVKARQAMRALAAGNDPAALEALALLAQLPSLPREDAEWAAERLLRHPQAKTEHDLLAVELQLRWHPERYEALVAGTTANYAKPGSTNLLALGRWLNRLGEHQRTVACIPSAAALQSQDLLLVRLDAMAALGRWAEISEVLEDKQTPLEPVLRDLFRARVAKELGQPEAAALLWRRVHLGASDKPAVWLYIAQYAERIGDADEAAKAWRRLTQDPNLGHTAYEALIQLGEREGNTRALREIMKEMTRAYPDEPEPRNDFAYLNGLLSEDLHAARDTAKRLVAENPNFLAYRTTLALTLWRLNEADAAAALYDGIELDWGAVLPGWQAVRVAVLGSTGKTNLARLAATRIPLNSLKPEERVLLRPYL